MNRDLDWSDVDADTRRMTEETALSNIDANRARQLRLEEDLIRTKMLVDIGHYLAKQTSSAHLLSMLEQVRESVAYCPYCDAAKEVLSTGVTPGSDPTATYRLECGHTVI